MCTYCSIIETKSKNTFEKKLEKAMKMLQNWLYTLENLSTIIDIKKKK